MENASKALIIAGSILVAILLISFGVMIFNSISDYDGSSQADQMKMTEFNGKFENYQGDSRTPNDAKSILSTIRTSNATEDHDVTLDASGIQSASAIKSGKTYKIELTYETDGDFEGYVSTVKITQNT